jgi:hypothetical protein
MIEINIESEKFDTIKKYAELQTIGGFSNLANNDLQKASRYDFQITGLSGEIAWYLYRYGSVDKLINLLDYKYQTLRPKNKGDDGHDDIITHNGTSRKVDVKTSHVMDENKISYLNLVIPEREYHTNMIYIAAFAVGVSRDQVKKVILAGWAANEHIQKRWKYDPKKYCVPVSELKKLEVLKKIL